MKQFLGDGGWERRGTASVEAVTAGGWQLALPGADAPTAHAVGGGRSGPTPDGAAPTVIEPPSVAWSSQVRGAVRGGGAIRSASPRAGAQGAGDAAGAAALRAGVTGPARSSSSIAIR